MLTSLATGFKSLAGFRFLLGLGESANWPGATKAVSEWFPRRDSGWAVALFDSGSSIGGALAPFIVLWAYHAFGSWRPAFIVTGVLGFLWLILFRLMYRRPEDHPRLSAEERALILEGRASATTGAESRLSYRTLLRLPQTWGIIIGKIADRSGVVLHHRLVRDLSRREGYRLEESLLAFWVPFLAADLGNFAGGGVSSYLIKRGWGVGNARKLVVLVSGLGMTLLIPTVFTTSYTTLVACFAISTFAYAAFSTMVLNLPADLYPSGSVASVSGMSGTGAGIGTIAATLADRAGRRSLVVRADPRRRQLDSAARDRRGARARAQHEGHRARHRQPDSRSDHAATRLLPGPI